MSRADWRQHFGPFWASFVLKKERFDPDNVLTPGQRIFY
jgi:cytokinin dehydrogenase